MQAALEQTQTGRTAAFRARVVDDEVFDPEKADRELENAAYREASEKCLRIWNAGLAHIGGRLLDPKCTIKHALIDFWTVCYAQGSYLCNGVSMTDRAFQLGIEKATLSRAVVDFAVGNGLPPSEYMRESDTIHAYTVARMRAIEAENARHESTL